jgi:hypothetical protein
MDEIVAYLESRQAIFHGALVLMILYVPHAGNLFMQLEHLDMTFQAIHFLIGYMVLLLPASLNF